MIMNVKQSAEWEFAGETKGLGVNLPQYHFVRHKSHIISPGLESGGSAMGSRQLTVWTTARSWKYT
jgi:hypothetical protein